MTTFDRWMVLYDDVGRVLYGRHAAAVLFTRYARARARRNGWVCPDTMNDNDNGVI